MDWAKRFFRSAIFTPGMAEAQLAAPDEVRFLWKALGLRRGSRVLDVACGTGRHAVRLARKGARVTGVDVTPAYLAEARRAAAGAKDIRFLKADMRRLPFNETFDAAYNVWTSFGYFDDPEDDLRALKAMASALKPGGLLLLDVLDGAWLRGHFEPLRETPLADGSRRVETSRIIEGRDPRVASEWLVIREGKTARAKLVVRLYDERRLGALLKRAELSPLRRWSSLSERRVRGRLVLLARKS